MTWYSLFLLFLALLGSTSGFRKVCYYTNWAQYRHGKGKFVPEDVDPFLCTHVIYAFAKPVGLDIQPYEWNDDSTQWSTGMYDRMMAQKQRNPNLKVILAIGGWNMASAPFEPIVDSATSRATFAQNVIAFLRQRNFDGIDIDWEYPGSRGSPPGDKAKLVLLMQALRTAFDGEAASTGKARLLLTGAFPAGKDTIDAGYDLPAIHGLMDFISLMTYDLHGSWDPYTGIHSPLYAHPSDTGTSAYLNLDWVARYYVAQGVPRDKLNIGMATYGRSFTLDNPNQHDIGSPAGRAGDAGQFTSENGFLAYYEICDMIGSGGTIHDVPSQRNRYVVSGSQWVGYDDVQSIKEKACYTKQNGFGGVMFWALDLDDFSGTTCGQGTYPLITAAIKEMENPSFTNCVGPSNPAATNPPLTQAPLTQAPPTYQPGTYKPYVPSNSAQTLPPYMFTLQPIGTQRPQAPQFPTAAPPQTFVTPTQQPVVPSAAPVPTLQPGSQPGGNNPYAFTLPVLGPTPQPPMFTLATSQPNVPTAGPNNPIATAAPFNPNPTLAPFNPIPTLGPVSTAAPFNPLGTTAGPFRPVPTLGPLQPTPAPFNPVTPGSTNTPTMTQAYNFDCTNKLNDFYDDPNSCDHFYICANAVTYRVQCALGLLFNSQVKHCDFAYNSNCPLSQPATPAPTQPPLVTNAPTVATVQPIYFQTTAAPAYLPTIDPSTVCAGIQNGLIAHPTDCHKFYQCVQGVAYELHCQGSQVFDPTQGACGFITCNTP